MDAESLSRASLMAFCEALGGRRGSLDEWLECNNEDEVRVHIEAYARNTVLKESLARLHAADLLRYAAGAAADALESADNMVDRQLGHSLRFAITSYDAEKKR